MWKNELLSMNTVRVIILAGCIGAIATACTNLTQSNSPPGGNSNQSNISPSVEKASASTSEQISNVTQSRENRRDRKRTSSVPNPKLDEGMGYHADSEYSQDSYSQKPPFIGTKFFNFHGGDSSEQSITILADGTTTVKFIGRGENHVFYQGKFTNPIIFQDNTGSGLLLKEGKIFSIYGNGKIAKDCKTDGQVCVSDLFEPTTEPPEPVKTTNIQDGYYVLGGTGQGLEVRGNKYRYYDEGGEKEWRDIRELKSIKAGLIFDGKEYWCLPPNREVGVCTENGWKTSTDNL